MTAPVHFLTLIADRPLRRVSEVSSILAAALACSLPVPSIHAEPQPAVGRPNVLWVTLEDTNDWISCYGDPSVNTPIGKTNDLGQQPEKPNELRGVVAAQGEQAVSPEFDAVR